MVELERQGVSEYFQCIMTVYIDLWMLMEEEDIVLVYAMLKKIISGGAINDASRKSCLIVLRDDGDENTGRIMLHHIASEVHRKNTARGLTMLSLDQGRGDVVSTYKDCIDLKVVRFINGFSTAVVSEGSVFKREEEVGKKEGLEGLRKALLVDHEEGKEAVTPLVILGLSSLLRYTSPPHTLHQLFLDNVSYYLT